MSTHKKIVVLLLLSFFILGNSYASQYLRLPLNQKRIEQELSVEEKSIIESIKGFAESLEAIAKYTYITYKSGKIAFDPNENENEISLPLSMVSMADMVTLRETLGEIKKYISKQLTFKKDSTAEEIKTILLKNLSFSKKLDFSDTQAKTVNMYYSKITEHWYDTKWRRERAEMIEAGVKIGMKATPGYPPPQVDARKEVMGARGWMQIYIGPSATFTTRPLKKYTRGCL